MRINGGSKRSVIATAALSLALLAACATPARQARVVTPQPCADSTYVQLKRQQPDSLSEREWQRLQSLDRDCATARLQPHAADDGTMGWGHFGMMGVGLMAALMTVMMITMW